MVPLLFGFKQPEQKTELKWIKLENKNRDEEAGEILAAFELYLLDEDTKLPDWPPLNGSIYRVPDGIRPELERTIIEVKQPSGIN